MSLRETIEKASSIAGGQTALAELIGARQPHLSAFKAGTRVCGLKTRIKIAEIAGVDRVRTIFEYFVDSLDVDDEHEKAARDALMAILDAFPPETDEPPESRKPLKAQSLQGSGSGGIGEIRTLDKALHPILP